MTISYYVPTGGLPGQTELTTNRAVFTEAYAVLPRGTMRDIVTSLLPFWERPDCGSSPARCPVSPRPSPSTSSRCHPEVAVTVPRPTPTPKACSS